MMELHINERDPMIQACGWQVLPVVYKPAEVEQAPATDAGRIGGLAMLDIEGTVHYGLRPDAPKSMRASSIASFRDWLDAWRANLPAGSRVGIYSTPIAVTGYHNWAESKRKGWTDEWCETLVAVGVDCTMASLYDRYAEAQPSPQGAAYEAAIAAGTIELCERLRAGHGLPFHCVMWHRQKSGTAAESGRLLTHEELLPIIEVAVGSAADGIIVWSSDHWHVSRSWTASDPVRAATRMVYEDAILARGRPVRWNDADRELLLADALHARRSLCSTINELLESKAEA